MNENERKLGELLIQRGWIDSREIAEALKIQASSREFLGRILVREKKITEEQLARILAEQGKIPFMRLTGFRIDWPLVKRFSSGLIVDRQCFPLRIQGTEITFAITNLLDAWTLSGMETEARGYRIQRVLITQSDMNDLLARYKRYVSIKVREQFDEGT